jgi:hypothetical protein
MQKTLTPSDNQVALAARLRPLTLLVRGLLVLGTPLMAAVPVWLWLAPESLLAMGWAQSTACSADLVALIAQGVSPALRWRLVGISVLPVGLGLLMLAQLWGLFAQYGQGAVFSPKALQRLRGLAWSLVALFCCQPVVGALQSVALSWDHPPGQRQLALSFSSDDYVLLLFALLLLALAKVMQEAARVAQENEGFV